MTPDPPDELLILVRKAHAGVSGSLAELRAGLHRLIPWADLERLDREAREAWAAATADGRADRAAAKLRALGRAAARLARPGAGPLEVLLAGRAALTADVLAYARRAIAGAEGGGPADPARRALDRRVARAAREHAAAERTLQDFQERIDVVAGEDHTGAPAEATSGTARGCSTVDPAPGSPDQEVGDDA